MKRVNKKFYLLAAVALCGFAGTAMATPFGNVNVANCGGGGVTVTATTITWLPLSVPGSGCIISGSGTSVTYSSGTLLSGVTGNIKNLTAGGGAVDLFMSFTGTPLDFILTGLGPGSANTACGSLALFATCSVFAGSPFTLTNIGPNATIVGLAAGGTVTDLTGSANWAGAFSTQINQTAGSIQTTILDGGSITSTQSGQFILSSIPEPATMSMMGIGLLGLGLIARRRKS